MQRHALAPARALLAALVLTVAGWAAAPAVHAVDPVNKTYFGNLAIHGYDPVAYFDQGRPVEGSDAYEYEWKGATWRFASQAHLERFRAEPARYAPQYGGYCAYAVSQGGTADIDPEAWKIVEGKLYLNVNKNVQKTWEQDLERYIEQADRNWPGLRDEG